MTTLIIARHGNTFNKGETPTRVGARTDLPLVESGHQQARNMGLYLRQLPCIPTRVYAAPLKRTIETAQGALDACGLPDMPIQTLDMLTEIDYGPDENKTEDVVVARLGQEALDAWNQKAIVPNGWRVNPQEVIQNWCQFAHTLEKEKDQIALVLTSNGIARFAPYITGDFDAFVAEHTIKMGTGCLSFFTFENGHWICTQWNVKPTV